MKSPVYDFRSLVGAYPKVWPFKTLNSWNPACFLERFCWREWGMLTFLALARMVHAT